MENYVIFDVFAMLHFVLLRLQPIGEIWYFFSIMNHEILYWIIICEIFYTNLFLFLFIFP